MKRILLVLILLGCGELLYAQHIEITIKDGSTGEVLPFVYAKAIKQSKEFETISNLDGRIKLPDQCDSIILSHISYEPLKIRVEKETPDVLLLVPKVTELSSITIFATDLKKKIEYLLENFSRLYINNQRTYSSTYKETFRVNDSLVRLLQFNMQWWNKEYETDLKKSFELQNQIAIGAVDYSKAMEGKTVFNGALKNKSLFSALHLNSYLTALLWQGKDYTVLSIEKTNTSTKISFDATIEQQGKVIGNLKDCYFIFDNKTKALLELHTELIYTGNQVAQVMSVKEKEPIAVRYKKETRTMSFIKDGNKLRLSYFEYEGEHEDQIRDKIYSSENKLSVYITDVEKGKKLDPAATIQLGEKPIYEYIQKTPMKNPTILLTKEEWEFVNETSNN